MQDSLKGALIALTVIGLFITSILSFITLFPEEQGVSFSGGDQNSYLTISQNNATEITNNLQNINNQTSNSFDQWDVTQGFMGTNQLKQGQGNVVTFARNIFKTLTTMATELFGANSPILYAISVFLILTITVLIYMIIKFVRSGN